MNKAVTDFAFLKVLSNEQQIFFVSIISFETIKYIIYIQCIKCFDIVFINLQDKFGRFNYCRINNLHSGVASVRI